ncbi:hypothetical protein TNCT_385701 [Trichonephila clavata]|uniref:Uncharacterized protein n=1 Tax=Trichonephila clavata TaxID=2740835 RepID=A0A8X6LMQ7_TRICU|nr:hypothetical protein TNCT_385701 [Trichonephila clavata]
MATMDVDPPDSQCSCSRRIDLKSTVVAEDACIVNFSEFIDIPDTDHNIHLKEIVRKQIMEHQQGKDAALIELESLPPCNNPTCPNYRKTNLNSKTPSPMPEEPKIIVDNPPIITNNNNNETPEANPLPKRKQKKKRKKPKDSTDDFVFPKKTARPSSPTASEPIATAKSFSDLESDVDEETQPVQIPQDTPPLNPFPLSISK